MKTLGSIIGGVLAIPILAGFYLCVGEPTDEAIVMACCFGAVGAFGTILASAVRSKSDE